MTCRRPVLKRTQTLTLSAGLLAIAVPMSADAEVLVAGWDTFNGSTASSSAPSQTDGVTGATMSGTSGDWGEWNFNVQGASGDGTFGGLSSSVASATTTVGTNSNQGTNLSMNRSRQPGSLTFSLVNNSGADRVFQGFYFDGAAHNGQSSRNWELTFSNAISGATINGTLTEGGMSAIDAADRDKSIDEGTSKPL